MSENALSSTDWYIIWQSVRQVPELQPLWVANLPGLAHLRSQGCRRSLLDLMSPLTIVRWMVHGLHNGAEVDLWSKTMFRTTHALALEEKSNSGPAVKLSKTAFTL